MKKKMEPTEELKRIWASFKPDPEDNSAFYKVVRKTMVLQSPPADTVITFPSQRKLGNIPFLQYHPEDLNEVAKFQLPPDSRQYPKGRQRSVEIVDRQIKVPGTNDLLRRKVSCSGKGGWKSFVEDNDIRADELLIFVMIGRSTYRAHRFPERVANKPAFTVTVHHPHNCGLGYLETPEWTSLHHLRVLLQGTEIILARLKPARNEEDNDATVRSWVYGRWKRLAESNNLKVEDRLLFYETDEPAYFDVKLMDPIP